MNEEILELLYRSFDHELSPEEQQRLEEALASSAELRQKRTDIEKVRAAVARSRAREFRPLFAERVMGRVSAIRKNGQEEFLRSLVAVFRPVALAAAMLAITLTTFNLAKSDRKSVYTAFAGPEVSMEQALDPTLPLALE